jgi:hypothetical protein
MNTSVHKKNQPTRFCKLIFNYYSVKFLIFFLIQ